MAMLTAHGMATVEQPAVRHDRRLFALIVGNARSLVQPSRAVHGKATNEQPAGTAPIFMPSPHHTPHAASPTRRGVHEPEFCTQSNWSRAKPAAIPVTLHRQLGRSGPNDPQATAVKIGKLCKCRLFLLELSVGLPFTRKAMASGPCWLTTLQLSRSWCSTKETWTHQVTRDLT